MGSQDNTTGTDWTKWEPAGDNDVRSPCPMINALANHHILPHDGRCITKEMAVHALTSSLNLDSGIANIFSTVALTSNPDHSASSFDLHHVDKHGLIEHDVSLSRDDYAFGDNHSFDKGIFKRMMATYGDDERTTFETASRARWNRVVECKQKHEAKGKDFQYGIKEFVLSYGETALLMAFLGDPQDGKISTEYLRIFFEQERLPFNEGWEPPAETIAQNNMNHLIFNLIKANENKDDEASEVGLGTIHAVTAAVENLLPSYCTIM